MLKKVRHSPEVDLSTNDLGVIEKTFKKKFISKLFKDLNEEIELSIEKDTCLYFPIEYQNGGCDGINGKPINDPDVMYLSLPLGEYSDESPTWSFRLSDVIDEAIDLHRYIAEKEITLPTESSSVFIPLRDHLRALADKIDEALERGKLISSEEDHSETEEV